jgi:hypothetical protein
MSERGIGRRVILDYLNDVPGITLSSIQQDLASLKQSGQYAKIVERVHREIEEERLPGQDRARQGREAG